MTKDKAYAAVLLLAGVATGILFTLYDTGGAPVRRIHAVHYWMSGQVDQNVQGKLRLCRPRERLQHVRRICNANNNFQEMRKRPWFVVDKEHQLLNCNIPKTGSSTMKTLIMTSTKLGLQKRTPKASHKNKLLYARGLDIQKYSYIYENYTKIIIVRNPYERLISAYKDKFLREYHPNKPSNQFVIMKERILKTFSNAERKQGFSFPQFVDFLRGKNSVDLDEYQENRHWDSYEHVCSPCLIPYDYILRTEVMGQEVDRYVLPLLNRTPEVLSEQSKHISTPLDSNTTSTYGRYLQYFEQLSGSQVQFLQEMYSSAGLMFGYGFDERSYYTSCGITTDEGDRCC